MQPLTLLIPEKTDTEFKEVLRIWTKSGGLVRRLGKYWIKDEELTGKPIAIYGNQTFALVLLLEFNACWDEAEWLPGRGGDRLRH